MATKKQTKALPSSHPEKENEESSIEFLSIFKGFRYRITCLGTAISMINKSRNAELTYKIQGLFEWSKNNNISITEDVNGDSVKLNFSIPEKDISTFHYMQEEMNAIEHASYVMRRNLIISLVSEFDNLLAELIKLAFRIQPKILDSSSRSLTLSELSKFSTVDEAREYLIEKEVENVLRENHSEQLNYIQKKFSLKDLCKIPGWVNFIEVTERRNVFVHCDGKVSRQYISVCKEKGIKLTENCDLNTILDVDNDYFHNSYKELLKIGIVLTQKMWRQLKPGEQRSADDVIAQLCFELILVGEYDLAIEILTYSETNFYGKSTSEITRMNSKLNKAQAYKWMGKAKEMKSILDKIDFTAVKDEFKLAQLVLDDKFIEAAQIVEKIGSKSDLIKEDSYGTWPIFREFIKSEEFTSSFEVVFNREFNRNIEESIKVPEEVMSETSHLEEFNPIVEKAV